MTLKTNPAYLRIEEKDGLRKLYRGSTCMGKIKSLQPINPTIGIPITVVLGGDDSNGTEIFISAPIEEIFSN